MKKLLSVLLTVLLIAGTVVSGITTASAATEYTMGDELITNGDFSSYTVNTRLVQICGHNSKTIPEYITLTQQNYGRWLRPTNGVAWEADAYANGTTTPDSEGEYPVYFKQNDTVIAQPDNANEKVLRVVQSAMQYVNAGENKAYKLSFRYRIGGLASFYANKATKARININFSSFATVSGSDKIASSTELLIPVISSGFSATCDDSISVYNNQIVIAPTIDSEWHTAEIMFSTGNRIEGTTADYDSDGDGDTDISLYPMLTFVQDIVGTEITVSEKAYISNAFYLDDVSLKEVSYLTDNFSEAEVYDTNGNKLALNDSISTSVAVTDGNYSATVVYPENAGLTFKGWYKDGSLVSSAKTLSIPMSDTSTYVPQFVTRNLAYASASFESYAAGTSFKHTDTTTQFPTNGQWGGIKTAGYRGQTFAGTFYDNQGNEHTQYKTGSYSDATTTSITTDYAYSGNKSLYFSGAAWAFGTAIEGVTPGNTYTVSYRIKRNPTVAARTTLKATAVLTTLNIGNTEGVNTGFKNHVCNLYDSLALTTKKNVNISSDNWELISMEFTVPEKATNLDTVYLVIDSTGAGTNVVNQFFIDDLVVLEKREEVNIEEIPVVFCNSKGEAIESANSYGEVIFNANDDSTVNLTVKYTDSPAYAFLGWYDKDNKLVSTETSLNNVATKDAAGYTAKIRDTNIYTAASYEGYSAGASLTHTDKTVPFPVNGQWGGFAWAGYRKQTVAGTVYDNKGNTYTQIAGGTYSNGVTATVSDAYAHSGTKSLLLSGTYWTMVGGINNVKAGKTYELSFWAKKDPTLTSATNIKGVAVLTTVNIGQSGITALSDHISNRYSTIGLPWDDGKYYQSNIDVSNGDWVKFSTRFTVPETAAELDTVYLSIDASGNDAAVAGKLYIDDISVSQVFDGIKTAYNKSAAIRTAAASSTGKNGMRIYNRITKDFIEEMNIVEYGSFATLSSLVDGDFTLDNTDIPFVKGVAFNSTTLPEASLWDTNETENIYTSYLSNIPELRYDDSYTIRAYAIDSAGTVYYGDTISLSLYDVVLAIDNGNGTSAQTDEDIAAFNVFAGGQDGKFTMYDKWLKDNLTFSGRLRNIAKAEDTLSGDALTEALEVNGYYEPFFERAIANQGNRAMLKAMFEKAERGEDITVVGFGGSITQKAACTNELDSYSHLVAAWLRTKFPKIKVNWYNAGIGSTTSVLGIARMQDHVLTYEPDLVILDFTTNDQTNAYHAGSYEAILRTLYQKQIAVVTIAFGNVNNNEYKADGTCHRGTNREELHGPVMLYNDVPVIDYYGVMWDCYLDADGDGYNADTDAAHWKTLWADYIHPSVAGHKLAGNAINYYLEKVYSDMDNITETISYPAIPLDAHTESFMGAMMYGEANIGAILTDSSNVTIGNYNNYDSTTVSNWTIWQIAQGGYIEFTIPKAKLFALMSINGPTAPVAQIYVNGTLATTHTASRTDGELNWMNFIEFMDGSETVTIKIVCTSGTYRITAALIA